MRGLHIGVIVHYRPGEHNGNYRYKRCIPAMITRVWNPQGTVNMIVFPDGSNDVAKANTAPDLHTPTLSKWETSVVHESQVDPENAEAFNSWHFAGKCTEPA